MNTVNRIRQEIGLIQNNMSTTNYNGTTGSAADIATPTGFASSIEDEKRKYKIDDPTAQRVFKIIEDIDSKIDNMNEELNKLNDVKTPVTKTQVLKKLETLKTLIEITNKYYPKAEEIDKYNKKGIPYRKDELIYWFDRVINKVPKTINNTNRLVEKYAYYNADKVKNIKKLKEDMYETEKIFPENLKSKITLFTKVSSRIIYLINRIIDNINYRRNPDLKEIEEIDPKYGKKLKMSEENEAIYDYALTHQYDPNNVNELKKFLMRDDVEGYRSNSYQDINGVWTIGYGDTHGVKYGMTTTKEKAEEKLESNIKLASIPIQNYIKIAEKNTGYSIPLTQNQFDSLVSMSFNAGPGTVNKKIIVPYLSKGDYIGAAKQIPYLTEDSYKGGLPKRRKLEKEYFWKGLEFIINF